MTCREYLEFMSDDGYSRPDLWLSDGWEIVKRAKWQAPLYWERDAAESTGWKVFTLRGWHSLSDLLDTPVCHVSFFEADAFAKWCSHRLPTEAEWESIASLAPPQGNFLETALFHPASAHGAGGIGQIFGDCWEWTASAYAGHPGIQTSSWGSGRIQRKIYVLTDDSAGWILRHASGSHAGDVSQFLPSCCALAVLRNPLG